MYTTRCRSTFFEGLKGDFCHIWFIICNLKALKLFFLLPSSICIVLYGLCEDEYDINHWGLCACEMGLSSSEFCGINLRLSVLRFYVKLFWYFHAQKSFVNDVRFLMLFFLHIILILNKFRIQTFKYKLHNFIYYYKISISHSWIIFSLSRLILKFSHSSSFRQY